MSSNVFFKFKSQKEPQRVTFDGTGISVFELKRDIITQSHLGDGTDFDLSIYNQDTNEEYTDDTAIIPRSTSVIARRLPASKPGQGRAARYVSGLMPTTSKNAYRTEKTAASAVSEKASNPFSNNTNAVLAAQTEEEKIAAMFKAGDAQWEQQKQQMAGQTPIFRPNANKAKNMAVPDHPPPPGYVCHRCRQKGHWIQACPTNNDPKYDNNPRVKRTTGIPRSFLVTVDEPEEDQVNDGLTDDKKQPSSIMINSDGKRVIAVPDKGSWEEYKAKADASAVKQDVATIGSKELEERGLECPIDKRLFVDPMKTPCCSQTYCNDCIENALVNSDLVCPNCGTEGVLFDNLARDEDMSLRIKAYEEEKKAQSTVKTEARDLKLDESTVAAGGATDETQKARSQSPRTVPARDSSTSTPVNSKKRPADAEIPDGEVAPKVQKIEPQQQTSDVTKPTSPQQKSNPLPPPSMSDQDFVAQMNMLAQQQGNSGGNNMMNNMAPPFPMNMNGFNPMNMPGMMGMNPAMMNPMMMNMGMPGFGLNAMNNTMGFPDMNNMNMNFNTQGGQQANNWQGNQTPMFNNPASFRGGAQGFRGGKFPTQNPQANGDDDAYMRKPVNPHRYPGRQRKARPTDYREL